METAAPSVAYKNDTVAPAVLRVALIGCGAKKVDRRARARELYTGSLFRFAVAWASQHCDRAFVVSAMHGLVDLDTELDPYNRKIADLGGVADRDAWGERTIDELARKVAGVAIAPVLLLGEEYARHLRYPLNRRTASWRELAGVHARGGAVWTPAAEPLRGLQIGERLSWFKRAQSSSGASTSS
jgi:hypothetical protein